MPTKFITSSTKLVAINNLSFPVSTTLYSYSPPTVIPVLPGNVHGVVVQITINVSLSKTPFPSCTGNLT